MLKNLTSLIYGLYNFAAEHTIASLGLPPETFSKIALSDKSWIAQRRKDIDEFITQLKKELQKGIK